MITAVSNLPKQNVSPLVVEASYVLGDIRKIIRASDIHSKRLQRQTGLTTAQALIIRTIAEMGEVSTRALSDAVSLSPATVTTVLDRLELNGYVQRYRSTKDRRIVHAKLTRTGLKTASGMPDLMDDKFIARFGKLSAKQRKELSSALAKAALMMDAGATDAAPTVNGREPRVKRA